MANNILVVAEYGDGKFKSITHQLLGEAGRLAAQTGGTVEAVAIGNGVKDAAGQLGAYGAGKVYAADDASLKDYDGASYAPVLVELVKRTQPMMIFLGATPMGLTLGPRLATQLQCALTSDCTAFALDGGAISVTRPVYGGRAVAVYQVKKLPLVATLRQNAFAPAAGGGAATAVDALTVTPVALKTKVVEMTKAETGKIELTEAPIVISGGRGMQGPENFAMLESLASVLGGAVGATRAVVDAGWRPYSEQVGQTGKTVSPTLYIAAGVSGAMQHLVGMKTSKVIVAINKDPEAPIFKVADYGIVADAMQVVPLLTEACRQLKA
ncbi:MAG: electron transfer flavoprotein subunit alpha/FixB family protein [Chloroflexi bacterium]|nr:electron transfer flavoprotein subunit alpha/FixB family protein [Chloroflexota bacterium]